MRHPEVGHSLRTTLISIPDQRRTGLPSTAINAIHIPRMLQKTLLIWVLIAGAAIAKKQGLSGAEEQTSSAVEKKEMSFAAIPGFAKGEMLKDDSARQDAAGCYIEDKNGNTVTQCFGSQCWYRCNCRRRIRDSFRLDCTRGGLISEIVKRMQGGRIRATWDNNKILCSCS